MKLCKESCGRRKKRCDSSADVDRISQLPNHILHCILSLLSTRDAARVSVLSKAWYGFFTCFPMSDFCFPRNVEIDPERIDPKALDRILNFANFVYNSLLRQRQQNSSIPKFRLRIKHNWSTELTDLTNRCIQLATQSGVKELDLNYFSNKLFDDCDLPVAIFSAKELVVCRLTGGALGRNSEPTVYWPSLRELSMERVFIYHNQIIDNLNSSCPLIEKFALKNCGGMDCLRLLGFTKLKKVTIETSVGYDMEKIEIDALSLQTFSSDHQVEAEIDLDFGSCKNLKVLVLKYLGISDTKRIQDLIPKFPALKVLRLEAYFEGIEISGQQLEKLRLFSSSEYMENVVIDAPRLQSFHFGCVQFPSSFSLNKSSLEEATLDILCFNKNHGEYIVLENLREFLINFNQIDFLTLDIKCYRSLCDHDTAEISSNNSRSVLLDINHLKLNINLAVGYGDRKSLLLEKSRASYDVLVEGVLRMCHPESLLLESGRGTNNEFMRVFCEKLMRSAEHQRHCCAATDVKCWRHDLKDIQIEHRGRNRHRRNLTCQALLDSLQTLERNDSICFVLEWY